MPPKGPGLDLRDGATDEQQLSALPYPSSLLIFLGATERPGHIQSCAVILFVVVLKSTTHETKLCPLKVLALI